LFMRWRRYEYVHVIYATFLIVIPFCVRSGVGSLPGVMYFLLLPVIVAVVLSACLRSGKKLGIRPVIASPIRRSG